MKKIVVIDYECGNLLSLYRAIEFVGYKAEVTKDKQKILNASHLILPGVGAFGHAMNKLEKFDLKETIKNYANLKKPLLGICLGMQALFSKSNEFGVTEGLDMIKGEVIKIKSSDKEIKVPHIGWNEIFPTNTNENSLKIFPKELHGKNFYFVHSYIGVSKNSNQTNAIAKYADISIPAIVSSENVYGCQFHPEKSGKNGITLIKNFCNL